MLSEEEARNLGYKGKFYHKIQSPCFLKPSSLWLKEKSAQFTEIQNKKEHLHSFFKIGKTFGFETKRFIQYSNGCLFYYQGQKDKTYKGFCQLNNIYCYYLKLDDKYLLYLTNGNQSSQFFFADNTFYHMLSPKIHKMVIQLNFNQRYGIQKVIGKGSFSKVYQGRNKETGQRVAIKIVSKKDKNGVLTKNIVEEQKKVLSLLDSKFTYQLIEFFQEDDAFIFILQFLEGDDLMHVIKQNQQMTIRQCMTILKSILMGLRYCHQSKIIHRDLKPQNIIIDKKTRLPKLIDFGLSLYMGHGVDKRKFKRCGTMGYMAYEVIRNTSQVRIPYDYKCDLFSYGIIAHMLLIGINPLKGKNYDETKNNNTQCKIDLKKQLIIDRYGQQCYNLLVGLLQKDPKQRISAEQALINQFFSEQNIRKMQKIALKGGENMKSKQKISSSKTLDGAQSNQDNHLFDLNENELEIRIPRVSSNNRRPSHFIFNQD